MRRNLNIYIINFVFELESKIFINIKSDIKSFDFLFFNLFFISG